MGRLREHSVDIARLINEADAKRAAKGLSRLSPVERVLSLVSHAYFEVELGGLSTFYYNSAGRYAVESVAALRAIGATRFARVLERANRLFPGGAPPRGRVARYAALQRLSAEAQRRLERLEDEPFEQDHLDLLERYLQDAVPAPRSRSKGVTPRRKKG
jgi:hypothetical protein